MRNVTEDEIDFILDDITKRGIVTEDVRNNILDHVCCIIENEFPNNGNFNVFYENTIARFYKKELSEIEEETTNLLTFKYYYAMKRTLKISGLISIILIIIGAILKTLHLQGAGVTLVLGFLIFSFVFIPLNIILTNRDDKKTMSKIVMTLGMLITLVGTIGLLFKVMRWPYANVLFMGSLFVFGIIFIPLYFFTRYRDPETKFNAIINSTFMIAAAGMLFTMTNLGYSKATTDETVAHQQQVIQQIKETNNSLLKTVQVKDQIEWVEQSNKVINTIETLNHQENQSPELLDQLILNLDAYNNSIKALENTSLITIEADKKVSRMDLELILLQLLSNENRFLRLTIEK